MEASCNKKKTFMFKKGNTTNLFIPCYYLGLVLFVKSQNYVTQPSKKSSSHVRYILHIQCNIDFYS